MTILNLEKSEIIKNYMFVGYGWGPDVLFKCLKASVNEINN